MLKHLPVWKERIIRSIETSYSNDQLEVCEAFIALFNLKYSGLISLLELAKHNIDLDETLERKRELLNPKLIQK